LLVSHDRYLVDRLAQHIWSIEEGELLAFTATYQEFLAEREGGAPPAESEPEAAPEPPAPVAAAEEAQPTAPAAGWSRQARHREERRRRALATELEDAEYWLARTAEALEEARAAGDAAAPELEAEHTAARARLDELLAEWELLA
ncbi:MAG TPA: hypothetical protein PLH39_04525, partial [Promineifilum sp.]|nr:hypothetical protein [Promineifilum sp.]